MTADEQTNITGHTERSALPTTFPVGGKRIGRPFSNSNKIFFSLRSSSFLRTGEGK